MFEQRRKRTGVVLASMGLQNQNPLVLFQEKVKGIEAGFKTWLGKQSIAVETAVVTAVGAGQGAAMGGLMSTFTSDASPVLSTPPNATPDVMSSLKQAQALSGGPLMQARNFAVMTGVNAGLACVMKRIRGAEDVQGSMVAAFGSGAMFSLVSGMGGAGPNQAANAISSGILFALVQGGLFQFGKKMSAKQVEDPNFLQTNKMLKDLGLEKYSKNFKKGLLTDQTLPLLNDSALNEIRIPPGPRLIILDHIQRDRTLKSKR